MIILGSLALAGLLGAQAYWVSQAVSAEEETFDHNVRMSLRSVADNMCQIDGNELIAEKPIDRISRNYFIARLRYNIDVKILDSLIREQFQLRQIDQDYEYGIYNCETDRMVFGNQVSGNGSKNRTKIDVPRLANDEYYFGVYFPNKTAGLLSDLTLWKYLTGASVLVMGFFVYGLVIVLKQRRLSEVREDFIDNVTHELKTPLATLRLTADALSNSTDQEKRRKYVEIIRQETARLERQVEHILNASVREGRPQMQEPPRPAIDILNELKTHMLSCYPHVRWQFDFSVGLEKTRGAALHTAVFNLLDNAAKYGKGVVNCTATLSNRKLLVRVSDNGPGIPKHYHRRIFDKFFRVPTANIHDVKGYGLGMYLARQAVRNMGGKIQLQSGQDGTTFTLTIPLK